VVGRSGVSYRVKVTSENAEVSAIGIFSRLEGSVQAANACFHSHYHPRLGLN
jgi:hypothetical protein